jgi:hypothetical protein
VSIMAPRLDLQALLEDVLDTNKVYFQPPSNLQLVPPYLVYQRDNASTDYADNVPYQYTQRYQLTIIDRDPDSVMVPKIAALPMCRYTRHFRANNLNHDVFIMYY